MDILSILQDKIGDNELENISGFLGEPSDKIKSSVDLALNTFLSGLIDKSGENQGIANIMKVIKDGGHSGDLLDDLGSVFFNPEKTKLLVTIGNNIVGHFFGSESAKVASKISDLGGIKKTSASSLFSLAAPLVLGLIGKKVKSDRMDLGQMRHFLSEQSSYVQTKLPPALLNIFRAKVNPAPQRFIEDEEIRNSGNNDVEEENRMVAKPERKSNLSWLPWFLLSILLLLALYYFRSFSQKEDMSLDEVLYEDTLKLPNQIDIFDNSSIDTRPIDTPDSKDVQKSAIIEPEINETKQAVVPAYESPKEQSQVVLKPKLVETEQNSKPSLSKSKEEKESLAIPAAPIKDKDGWQTIGLVGFDKNTALIRNIDGISQLVTFLKNNPNKNIELAGTSAGRLAEDRAYAIRDALFEKGINIDRISVKSGRNSGNGEVQLKLK